MSNPIAESLADMRQRGFEPKCPECGFEPVDTLCECLANAFLTASATWGSAFHMGRDGIGLAP